AIGVLQRDMSLAQATHTYSILTIGDGLVSQIPAILATMAAGLVVTRTAGEAEDRHLGDAISRQVGAQPRVALITGLLALLMTLVPGFPWPVFLVLGLALMAFSAWRYRHQFETRRRAFKVTDEEVAASYAPEEADDFAPPPPLLLEMSPLLVAHLGQEPARARLATLARELRDESGVPLPAPVVRVSALLGESEFRLSAHGARVASGNLPRGAAFEPQVPGAAPLPGWFPPLSGRWREGPAAEGALAPADVLALHAGTALRRRLGSFLGIQETSNLFGQMQRDYPDLVQEMLRVVAPQRVADVLRRLAEEGVPIRNLRDAFEAITDVGSREKDVVLLTEYVRVALKREIAERWSDRDRQLHVLLIHPELEDKLRQ